MNINLLVSAGRRLKERRTDGALLLALAMFIGCTTDETPGFAPPTDPKATYSFKITPHATGATGMMQYNLTGITQQATAAGFESWIFLLKGKDKATKSDVYITGRVNANAYHSYLNITVAQAGNPGFFYKDCNNFICGATPGKDSRGSFVRLTFYNGQCVTTTLASERSMTIIQFETQLNPITFYIQED